MPLNPTTLRNPVMHRFRNFQRNMPYSGGRNSNMASNTANDPFTTAFKIKMLPLKDLSLPQSNDPDEFYEWVRELKNNVTPGDTVRGVLINSHIKKNSDKNGEFIVGEVDKIKVDWENYTIRVILRDGDLNKYEIYPESIELIDQMKYESEKYCYHNFLVETYQDFSVKYKKNKE